MCNFRAMLGVFMFDAYVVRVCVQCQKVDVLLCSVALASRLGAETTTS
jgi:hypothetical protein